MSLPDTIPAAKRAAVHAALDAIFGAVPVGATPIFGGASGALLFRVEADGRRFLLRVEGPPSPLRFADQYISQRLAADAGIAPALLYVDEASGIAVTDFIAQRPLRDYPGGAAALAGAIADLLRRLQRAPVFPFFVDYPDIVERLFAHVRGTGLFADGLLDPHVEHLARLRAGLTWDSPSLVSSHNDPNPRNILFDGERLWLIDWESAYRNDPLVDVAIALDNFAATPELEEVLLHAALGRTPDTATRLRLADVRALTRLYYAGVFLSAVSAMSRAAPETDLAAPSREEFLDAVGARRLTRGTRETLLILGKLFLSSFLSGEPVPPLDAV